MCPCLNREEGESVKCPERKNIVDDAGSQSPERVRTSVDNPGNVHLSKSAGQSTECKNILISEVWNEAITERGQSEV